MVQFFTNKLVEHVRVGARGGECEEELGGSEGQDCVVVEVVFGVEARWWQSFSTLISDPPSETSLDRPWEVRSQWLGCSQ